MPIPLFNLIHMVSQYNWSAVIKRIRKGIQFVLILIALAIVYINYGWLIQLFKNI